MLSRVLVVASITMSVVAGVAGAQPATPGYPTKPIRFIVPFPPGGGTDIVARLIGHRLSERLGQQVVIDNRGGANAIIGTDLAAKAPPDGYTILMSLQASLAVNPSLYRNLPYDSLRDFAPVIQLTSIPLLLTVHPSLPANSVKELVQLARAKPGQITFASSGTGGSSHLAMELFKIMAKVDMVHVPYKGGGPAINDLLGGQVQTYSGTAISLVPYVKAGRLKPLGVTTARRLPVLPDVPAVGETIAGYESVVWQGVVVPRATPSAIVTRLNREIAGVLQLPEVKERLTGTGATVIGGTPAEFDSLIKSEIAKYAKLIKETGVRPD